MTWLEIAALCVLFLGIGAGGFLVARRPQFWVGLAIVAFKAALPFLARRMPPEQEAEWRAAELAGRGDEWLRNRMRRKR